MSDLLLNKKMGQGQREALEVAEAAREKAGTRPSFGRDLFLGTFSWERIASFPEQSPEDKQVGDELVAKTLRFLKEKLDADAIDRTGLIPEEVISGLKQLGLFNMKIPKQYGGLGLSQVNYNRVMQAVASHCASTSVLLSAHQSIGVPEPLKLVGTQEQKQRHLTFLADGGISAFALTEPGVGSDPAKMTTTATPEPDGEHYLLNGEKLWCTNGPIADLLVVMAKTPPKVIKGKERQQITAFVVDAKQPGVELLHRCMFMGLHGIQNGWLRFTNVRVSKKDILWEEGRGLALALRTLNTGRLTLPAAHAGLGKQCLAIMRQFGKERVQWGKPVGEHEAGREKIAFVAATTFAIEAVARLTSHWADKGESDIRIEAAMAKLWTSEAGWQIVDKTVQLCGGRGYETADSLRARGETPFPVERMMRDTRINQIIEGTSEIMRLFIAREALDPYLVPVQEVFKAPFWKKPWLSLKLAGNHIRWYSARLFKMVPRNKYREMGPLAQHGIFMERCTNRLAKELFHKMVRHGKGLEERQLVLSALVDIGCELFAMAATCSYAALKAKEGKKDAYQLADHFCQLARRRIDHSFACLKRGKEPTLHTLSQKILDGHLPWLEEGILPVK